MVPSAKGLQSYRVYIIEDINKKERMIKATYDQEYVNAGLLLVYCVDPKRIKFMGTRGERLLAVQDATIAAAYAQLAATALGLSSVWIGHFNEKEVAKILKTKLRPVVVLPIGYPDEKPGRKEMIKLKEIVFRI